MPITARLSRRFYEQFGDDVVNELVELLNQVDSSSQINIRELNELNFARFDAKVGERMAELRAQLESKIDAGLAIGNVGLANVNANLIKGLAETNALLYRELAASNKSMLRWFLGTSLTLFITQMLAFAGLWFMR